jgi:hypothetical protein
MSAHLGAGSTDHSPDDDPGAGRAEELQEPVSRGQVWLMTWETPPYILARRKPYQPAARRRWHDLLMDTSASATEMALARWHAVVESGDSAGLPALIAPDAVFRSPAVHTPQVGRDTVVGYLTAAFAVLGPGLTYEREWIGDDSAVLQFRTEVGGLDVSGVDMITWDPDGQIVDFTVMVRPAKALQAVIEHMGAELLRMLEAAG